MTKSWKPLVCGAAYAVVAIIPTFLLTVGPATAATVTASASGTFGDAAGWTAVATWDESVMADNVVHHSEMLTFKVITDAGPLLAGGIYDLTDDVNGGFTFDGPSASAGLVGGSTADDHDYWFITDLATDTYFSLDNGRSLEWHQGFDHGRDHVWPGWDPTYEPPCPGPACGPSIWTVSVVPDPEPDPDPPPIPEPSTFTLAALALLSVGFTRRKRQRA